MHERITECETIGVEPADLFDSALLLHPVKDWALSEPRFVVTNTCFVATNT